MKIYDVLLINAGLKSLKYEIFKIRMYMGIIYMYI